VTLVPPAGQPSAYFGLDVDIANDTVAVVGTADDRVYVFTGPDVWRSTETLSGPAESGFGQAVAISQDQLTIVVGASIDTKDGRVHVFRWKSGQWGEQYVLSPAVGQKIGFWVAVSDDGQTVTSSSYSWTPISVFTNGVLANQTLTLDAGYSVTALSISGDGLIPLLLALTFFLL
jgi:hypothetical protein